MGQSLGTKDRKEVRTGFFVLTVCEQHRPLCFVLKERLEVVPEPDVAAEAVAQELMVGRLPMLFVQLMYLLRLSPLVPDLLGDEQVDLLVCWMSLEHGVLVEEHFSLLVLQLLGFLLAL